MQKNHNIFASCFLLVLLAWCAAVQAQQGDKTSDIGLGDLQGSAIHASISWAGRSRWSENNKVYAGENRWRLKVEIGEKGLGSTFLTREVRGAGRVAVYNYSGSGYIGQVSTRANRDGAGASVWSYKDNTLTFLKVFERGGRIVEIKLARTGNELTCTLRGAYLKENGASNVKVKNPFGPGYIEVLSMKQTSSTCRISKVASRT